MSKHSFQFKQFSLFQDKTAMKVGTDAVLLGAWANLTNANTILDIGSGTGILSLMAAQRNAKASIQAIEITQDAFEQSKDNFALSPWANRLIVTHTSIQDFETDFLFDHIISNPPYFETTFLAENKQRSVARSQVSLDFNTLLLHTKKLLHPKGNACFIIPYESYRVFSEAMKTQAFHLVKRCNVKGNSTADYKRILLEITLSESNQIIENELIIEIERHQYTAEYAALCKDFYLKL